MAKPTFDPSGLESERKSLVELIGEIPQYSLSQFQAALLPHVSKDNIERVKDTLKITSDKQWMAKKMGFATPSSSDKSESVTFHALSTIFNETAQAAESLGICTSAVTMQDSPDTPPISSDKSAHKTRPDACLVTKKRSTGPARVDKSGYRANVAGISWADIAATLEYKKSKNSANILDDISKVLWSMSLVMALDPCRRATFAFTVEDASMRVWFCDRSGFAVTDEFDFMKDLDTLLAIILAFCKASEQELGFDPTVQRVFIGETEQFIIRCQLGNEIETYRTMRVLSETGAQFVVSHGTRVWEVERLNSVTLERLNEPTRVLKDTWIETTRVAEGERYRSIKAFNWESEQDRILASNHFLKFRGDEHVLVNGTRDTTFELIRRNCLEPEATRLDLTASTGLFSSENLLGKSTHPLDVPHSLARRLKKAVVNKQHYRIVFDEVGVAISQAQNFRDVFNGICGANKGLILLQKMGLVHRDISISNILVVNNVGKLADLEFVMPYERSLGDTVHVDLSGTPYFMAAEVCSGEYIFHFDHRLPRKGEIGFFVQNYLHDAESLWWVALWFLVYTVPAREPSTQHLLPTLSDERRQAAESCFPSISIRDKSNPLYNSTVREMAVPPEYEPYHTTLCDWGERLMDIYAESQPARFKFVEEKMDGIHENLDGLISSTSQNATTVGRFDAIWTHPTIPLMNANE
ncbi:hypothetical protein BD410DRAFT_786685 [Rickenella mellea]|uniref:Fungal-type protein kinase domain-containing protein n=1 Tax=Rickenella mellea TaxID=50990 RepID=A0A4Y7Q8K2_9AGAM|nr:hypothetical protein BD410DRAFT_786685 [Rickenella mellea]